ncbi:hypothetical protein RND81_13G088000 [Saponaria officinalis]|uniref:DUF8039 domain-containing protein n=1 Tax=Saponaria officinalis TaxID=3572 RepID=A0AAW1GVA9_SAPOF
MLYCTINDFPAYGNLSGYRLKTDKGCPVCGDDTESEWLENSGKYAYMGHRRFLPENHPYRKRKKAFYGKTEYRPAQKHNIHPHYLGRAGYVGKKEEWFKEELRQEKENWPNDDPVLTQNSVVAHLMDRGYLWVKAHTPSSSAPPPQTREVIDKFKHYKEKEKKGEFVPTRFEDALVKAIGKPEHIGITRGVGNFVGLQTYFGKPASRDNRGKRYTDDDIRLLIEKAKSETMEEMNIIMENKIVEVLRNNGKISFSDANLVTSPKNRSPNEHDQSSCHSTHPSDPFIGSKERIHCRLAIIEDGEVVVVAEGMVSPWIKRKMVHSTPWTKQNAHVSIDRVIKANAPLPCPWNGFSKVGEVEGSFAQWPKTLILLGEDEANNEENNRKRKVNMKDTKESGNKVRKKATSVKKDKGKKRLEVKKMTADL